jgi:predicted membrane-bound mannosyltransferase
MAGMILAAASRQLHVFITPDRRRRRTLILAVDLNENVLLVVVVFRGVAVDVLGYITSRRKDVLDVLLARLLRLMRLRRLWRRHLQAYVLVQRGLRQDGLEGLSGTRPG